MARGANLPAKGTANPRRTVRKAGDLLYRVHSVRRPADGFNPEPQDHHFGGGRFDSTPNDSYAYLYAAPRPETAVVERFVRALRFDSAGNPRILPSKELEGRVLSQVRLARDVELVSLCSIVQLNAVRQSDWWLVGSEPTEYAFTRRWGHWLREEAPWADGFVWQSRLDGPHESLVLFGAAARTDLLTVTAEPPRALDDEDGQRWLAATLAEYGIELGAVDPAPGIGS
ncbi:MULTISPECIES: RES family NAD+ phosphorylase [Streptomyces]|uniref:RES family NAD+ phosphorylase n=1 Tax=Streptomyces griseiscabiei TaxID=2993540 RepID=A0ABU4L5B2_9ACTN|nr:MULTISPECIES: RES family NAD+ phosphorylase [Streptomyces]MBZ3901908.1 RES family NAD+ phosphorylase [Streptomyces griseiscabiei]MDX2910892.1 RES family NAD+ phosphorylase [Streptomyces griseiscabiei]